MSTDTLTSTQVYKVYIKASPERIWDAITKPEWTKRYGYTGLIDIDLRAGGEMKMRPTPEFKAEAEANGFPVPDVIIDGEVLEADPPRKLVMTWRMLMDPGMAAEGFTRVTQEIVEVSKGVCSLTLTHELEGAPKLAAMVRGEGEAEGAGGGHPWVLSDLKTLLETGSSFVVD
jgi:uncharacterized protein YndB with AHSA1/START domain